MEGTISLETFAKQYSEENWTPGERKKIKHVDGSQYKLPECYEVFQTPYTYKDPDKHYWSVTKIEIFKDGKLYMGFGRDYNLLCTNQCRYVRQTGADGKEREFLLTTSQYMFTTIVNLTDKTIKSYTFGNPDMGAGFCPTGFSFLDWDNPEDGVRNEFIIRGCVWGAPFEEATLKNVDLSQDLSDYFDYTKNKYLVDWADEDGNPYEDNDDE